MHISLIEDDKNLALRLKNRLEKDWFFVTIYFSFKIFMKTPNLNSDMYLIDLSLGDWNWFDIIKFLRNNKKLNTPIIITSANNNDEKKIQGLDLWADDYLPKIFSIEELLARIRAVMRRENNTTNNSILNYKNISLNLTSKKIAVWKENIYLTSQETKLVHFFMSNIWKMLSKIDLINSVWWDHEWIWVTDNTINVTISKVRKKLWSDFNLLTKINDWYILE